MKGKADFFTIIVSMLMASLVLIRYAFNVTTRWKFYGEMIVVLALLVLAALSILLILNKINSGYILSGIISLILLVNLFIFYMRWGSSTVLLLGIIASITGFAASFINMGEKRIVKKKEAIPPVKTYTPGKVVSSKQSKYYHTAKCDWAKKIKKANQVWYDTVEDAKAEGLEPHECVE